MTDLLTQSLLSFSSLAISYPFEVLFVLKQIQYNSIHLKSKIKNSSPHEDSNHYVSGKDRKIAQAEQYLSERSEEILHDPLIERNDEFSIENNSPFIVLENSDDCAKVNGEIITKTSQLAAIQKDLSSLGLWESLKEISNTLSFSSLFKGFKLI